MAIHNQQSLRSFPSFYEEDNFDDDDEEDDDHNFIIALDSSGDEGGQKSNNMASVHTSVSQEPHNFTPRQEVSAHAAMPHFINGNTYNPSNFTFSSNVNESTTASYNVDTTSNVNSIIQSNSNLTSSIFRISSENQMTSLQHVPSDHVLPRPNYNLDSNFWPETRYQENNFETRTCFSDTSRKAFSVNFTPAPYCTVSETVSSQFPPSINQNREIYDNNGVRHKQLESPVKLPKSQLETIHFDQDAGGMWSEAVFLSPNEMSDSSFSGIVNYPQSKTYFEKTKYDSPQKKPGQFTTSNGSSSSLQISFSDSHTSHLPPKSHISSSISHTSHVPPVSHISTSVSHTSHLPPLPHITSNVSHTSNLPPLSHISSSVSHTSHVPSSSQILPNVSDTSHLQSLSPQISSSVTYSSGIVPKLSGPYSKKSDPNTNAECLCDTSSCTVQEMFENVSKAQTLVTNALCTCIMCYTGRGIIPWYPEYEEAVLTEEEKQMILAGPIKRKRQRRSTGESKKKKGSSDHCTLELDCQTIPVSSSKSRVIKQTREGSFNIKSLTPVEQECHGHILYKQGKYQPIQPKPLSDAKAPENLLPEFCRHQSATDAVPHENITSDASARIDKPHIKYETPTTTAGAGLTSLLLSNPTPSKLSVPRFRSNPTKVFLKPTEVLGQRFQFLSAELNLGKNVSTTGKESLVQPPITSKESLQLPHVTSKELFIQSPVPTKESFVQSPVPTKESLVQSSVPTKESFVQSPVILKESTKTSSPTSTTTSSPPSYKIIYVSQDQVLVCPSQTKLSAPNQAHVSKSNVQNVSPMKMPPSKSLPQSTSGMHLPTVVSQNSMVCMYPSAHPSSLNLSKTIRIPQQLRQVLKNAEKVDISAPGKVIIKLTSPTKVSSPNKGNIQSSQTSTTIVPVSNTVTPVSKSSVASVLKDFKSPQVKSTVIHGSQSYSGSNINQNPKTSTISLPVVAKPSNYEVAQTLMSLIKSHLQEEKTKEKVLVNLLKRSLHPEPTNVSHKTLMPVNEPTHNIQAAGKTPSKHQATDHKPIQDNQTLISLLSGKKKPVEYRIGGNCEKVAVPHLPQEGLPSTYIQDWVNQTKAYDSEHISETGPESLNPSTSDANTIGNNAVCTSLLSDHSDKYLNYGSQINKNQNSSALDTHSRGETLYPPNLSSQSQQFSAPVQEFNFVPKPISKSSSVPNTASISTKVGNVNANIPADLSSIPKIAVEKIPQSCFLQTTSSTSRNTSYHNIVKTDSGKEQEVIHISSQSDNNSPKLSKTPDPALPSSLIDNSKGIKITIKLSELRKESWKQKRPRSAMETSTRNVSAETSHHGSENEFSLSKRNCQEKTQDERSGEAEKLADKLKDGDKIETAEEMFQRFQKQAEQEVLKAQMGMGYLSRSLRPSRATMAFIDKYPYRFGSGKLKKKTTSEDDFQVGSKKITEEKNFISLENKKCKIQNKRQLEESGIMEFRAKQPRLSMKDCPRFSQDHSITDCRNLFCSDILAGHKVYVKFNTYENVCSGRVFLVPFFNIGGTRTQFDVEDMEYINKSVLELEREERSCARHLLFYAREGQKAVFLRKETHFQTNQIVEKNYKKCSFILEGFRRDTKKQTETSLDEWKVDNTIDIEIDRAEVDNDAEIEFNIDMQCSGVAGKLGNTTEIEHEEDICHLLNHSVSAMAEASNEPVCLQSAGHNQSRTAHSVDKSFSYSQSALQTPSLDPILRHNTPSEVSPYTDQLKQLVSGLQYESNVGSAPVQVPCKNSTHLQKEVMPYSEIQSSLASFEVKQEQPDNEYENNIEDLSYPLNTGINSKKLSAPDHNQQSVADKWGISIKEEPLDEYFDTPVTNNQMEPNAHIDSFQSANILPCIDDFNSSKLPMVQNKPYEKEVSSSDSIVSGLDQQSDNTVVCSPTTHQNSLEDQIAEAARLQGTVETDLGDSTACNLEPALSSSDINTGSVKTSSNTEPSSESPLPSSSMSESSELSTSSDVDDKLGSSESTCSALSHKSLPVQEFITEGGNTGNQQSSVQSKITSLVESLRHRLTQDTSSLPPWLASADNPVTEAKKKKKVNRSISKEKSQDAILPFQAPAEKSQDDLLCEIPVSETIFQSVAEANSSSQAIPSQNESSCLSTAVVISLDESPSVAPMCVLPEGQESSPSKCSLSVSTSPCPVDTLQPPVIPNNGLNLLPSGQHIILGKGPMLLPTKPPVPFEDHPSALHIRNTKASDLPPTATSTSFREVDKVVHSQTDDPEKLPNLYCEERCVPQNKAVPEKAINKNQSALYIERKLLSRNNLNGEHKEKESEKNSLVYIEPADSGRRSPIDFEIEVGNEDLPETALSLQPILPHEPIDLEALKLNRGKHVADYDQSGYVLHFSENLLSSRLGKNKRRLSHEKKQHHLNNKHFELSTGSEKHTSVADYLSQKFVFSGASHKIQGPRLLHMSANRKTGCKEPKKQTPQAPNTISSSALSEPITTAELSTTPSVVEIFGASLGKNLTSVKLDSSTSCNTPEPTKINMKHQIECKGAGRAQVSKKRTWNRKARKSTTQKARPGKPKTASAAAATIIKDVSAQPQTLQRSKTSELLSKMKPCKIVITKLDLTKLNKLSHTVTEEHTDIKSTIEIKTEKCNDSNQNDNNNKPVFSKVIRKKRKKGSKVLKKPVLKPKRDIVDYYAHMLESLQKKAQQLEEESKRKAEENANKEQSSIKCQKKTGERKLSVNEKMDESSKELHDHNILEDTKLKDDAEELGSITTDGYCPLEAEESKGVTASDEVKDLVGPFINSNGKDRETVYGESFSGNQTSKEYHDSNIIDFEGFSKEQNGFDIAFLEHAEAKVQNGVDVASKELPEGVVDIATKELCKAVVKNGVDIASKEFHDTEVQNGADIASKEFTEAVAQNAVDVASKELPEAMVQNGVDIASKEHPEAVVDSGFSDVSDSNWSYLQQFCDETILNQTHSDYMQKVNGDVIFSKQSTASVSKVSFEKKDVVLGGSVGDNVDHGGQQDVITHTLHDSEDPECCLEGCSDELDRDHVEEDDMLLGLSIQKASAFSLDDHEDTVDNSTEDATPSSQIEGPAVGDISQGNISCDENAEHEFNLLSTVLKHNSRDCSTSTTSIRSDLIEPKSSTASVSSDPVEPKANLAPKRSDPSDSRAGTPSVNTTLDSCTITTQSEKLLTATGRSIHISPSWERLLGQTTLDVNEISANHHISSNLKQPHKPSVSLAASCNFQFKFKLPKGVLSKAVQLSRDMGRMFEGAEEISFNEPEGASTRSVEMALEKNSVPQNSSEFKNIDHPANVTEAAAENVSRTPLSQLKFSPGTLTAIQKAKAEFVQRKRGPKPKRGLAVKQSTKVPKDPDLFQVQDKNIVVGTANSVEASASDGGSDQTVQFDNLKSGQDLADLSGLILENGPSSSKKDPSVTMELKLSGGESDSQSGFNDIQTSINTKSSDMFLKQIRKDGIFSSIDFFQGLDNESTTKTVSEPPSTKKFIINSVIDISKLKLKLTPLLVNNVKEKAAQTSRESPQNNNASSHAPEETELLDGNIQNSPGSEDPEVRVLEVPEIKGFGEPEVKVPENDHSGVVKASECVSDNLDTPSSEPQPSSFEPLPSSSEPQPFSTSICKPTHKVNAAKLCNILKNFQNISRTATKSANNNADTKTLVSPIRETDEVIGILSETSPGRKNTRSRTLKEKVTAIPLTSEGRGTRGGARKAKEKANEKLVTASSINVPPPEKLVVTTQENDICPSDRSKSEDKGERSFFDCLSTVPLDTWEEKLN